MSFAFNTSGGSVTAGTLRSPAWAGIGLAVVLALGSSSSPFAQSPSAEPNPRGHALQGPPTPAFMRDSIGLDNAQLQRYSQRYADHMSATSSLRDSVRTSLQKARQEFESRGRSAARAQFASTRAQLQELSKRDRAFEDGIENILTKDQKKHYDQWKDARNKAAQERRQQFRRDRGNRWRPSDI